MSYRDPSETPACPGGPGPSARAALLVLLMAAGASVLSGCGGDGDVERSFDAADTAAAEGTEAGEPSAVSRMRGDTVVVEMDEYLIDLPDTLPAGRLVFEVRNMGFEEHNLEVHRDSLLFESGRPLNPRETRRMEVVLEPGSYRVICTVSGHEGRGMTTGLAVVERRPDT